jgi:hypothetical protein
VITGAVVPRPLQSRGAGTAPRPACAPVTVFPNSGGASGAGFRLRAFPAGAPGRALGIAGSVNRDLPLDRQPGMPATGNAFRREYLQPGRLQPGMPAPGGSREGSAKRTLRDVRLQWRCRRRVTFAISCRWPAVAAHACPPVLPLAACINTPPGNRRSASRPVARLHPLAGGRCRLPASRWTCRRRKAKSGLKNEVSRVPPLSEVENRRGGRVGAAKRVASS